MSVDLYCALRAVRLAWNKGRIAGQERASPDAEGEYLRRWEKPITY